MDRIETEDDRALVFGVTESGRSVSFHVRTEDAEVMLAQMAVGNVVQADLPVPDGPEEPDRIDVALKKLGEVTEHRRLN